MHRRREQGVLTEYWVPSAAIVERPWADWNADWAWASTTKIWYSVSSTRVPAVGRPRPYSRISRITATMTS